MEVADVTPRGRPLVSEQRLCGWLLWPTIHPKIDFLSYTNKQEIDPFVLTLFSQPTPLSN